VDSAVASMFEEYDPYGYYGESDGEPV
jgi:hypothetical protein